MRVARAQNLVFLLWIYKRMIFNFW